MGSGNARFGLPIGGLVLLVLCLAAPPASAAVSFTRAWGWGVSDGAAQFETCTSACQIGLHGGGAGQLYNARGVAVGPSGNVYVSDVDNNRIDEFSPDGTFIKAWGWGVSDGAFSSRPAPAPAGAGSPATGPGSSTAPRALRSIPPATST